MVASERAAEYPCAIREECVAAWNKAYGAPGSSVKKEVEAANPPRSCDVITNTS